MLLLLILSNFAEKELVRQFPYKNYMNYINIFLSLEILFSLDKIKRLS